MHISTRYCLDHKRPVNVTWMDDTLIIRQARLTRIAFATFVRSQLDHLEQFIKEKILFGLTLEDMGISDDISKVDDHDQKTPGYGPFSDHSGKKRHYGNDDFDKYVAALSAKRPDIAPFCLDDKGNIIWSEENSSSLIRAILLLIVKNVAI